MPDEGGREIGQFLRDAKKQRLEIAWSNLSIKAEVKINKWHTEKDILRNLNGRLKPGSFTAILGPSGSGKTTLLNFLSGRLYSSNLRISGEVRINSRRVFSFNEYSHLIAYVM